jgi:xylulokinase
MSWLGIDIGTSGCKAVVFDAHGRALASAYREYGTLMPQEGWAELDSAGVMDACLAVLAQAAGQVLPTDPVAGIGVCSQGEAFTALGPDGAVLNHAMVSFDTRAAALARSWPADFGVRRLYEITGHTAHPMFTLFKVLWLRDHRPEVWAKARHLYCFEELLHAHLGIEPAISFPLAGRTMLFNVRTHTWDQEVLEAVGLDPKRLARVLPTGTVVGTLGDSTARQLNVGPGTAVVAGGHDQPCGALGAGVTAPGRAMYGMGTVECICPAFPTAVFSDGLFEGNLCTYDFTAGGMYTTVAFSLTGGNLLRWYRDVWGADEQRLAAARHCSAYDLIVESMPEAPTDLLVLPYFTPSGTPYFETRASGAVLGLKLSTGRGELLKGLMEGVSLEMKLNTEILREAGIRIDDFVATGGGARSPRLVQLKADVLNRPITVVEVTEAGCLGVAMHACAALTGEPVADIARRWVRPVHAVQPRPEQAEVYAGRFERYRGLYRTLKPVLP